MRQGLVEDTKPAFEPTVTDRMFLTASEVGEQLGLKKSRVYELASAELLPVVRLGRRMLFPRRGLEALVDTAIERAQARMDIDPSGPRP